MTGCNHLKHGLDVVDPLAVIAHHHQDVCVVLWHDQLPEMCVPLAVLHSGPARVIEDVVRRSGKAKHTRQEH